MSKRLQVVLDDKEFADIQQSARKSRMTTAEWVRQALRAVRRMEPQGDVKKKLDVVRTAVRHEFPTADIDQMLDQIEQGYTRQPTVR
jgi:hypothetical protein